MTPSEAEDFSGKCKGNYPKMTDLQIAAIQKLVLDFDRALARESLADYVATVTDWSAAAFMDVMRSTMIPSLFR